MRCLVALKNKFPGFVRKARGIEEPPIWTIAEASDLINGIAPAMFASGLILRTIGPIDRNGISHSSLDLMAIPYRNDDYDYEAFIVVMESFSKWKSENQLTNSETWQLSDGREIDIYIGQYDPSLCK